MWRLSELSRALGLHKATAHRLLGALEREGMLTRDPQSETYRLGPNAIVLGASALRSSGLRTAARPELKSLAHESGETTTLEILIGDRVLILDEAEGRHLLGTAPSIGTAWPAHATSTGKVLLAFQSEEGAAPSGARAPPPRLARYTSRTITERDRLEEELARVRDRGYATAIEELERGFAAVGAPVRNYENRTVAAVSVGGPVTRFTKGRIRELADAVRRSGDRISSKLGAVGVLLSAALLFAPTACRPFDSPPSESPRGHLFLVGGGSQPADLVSRFVELAGGPGRARVAVIPAASGSPEESGREKAEQLRGLGADAFVLSLTRAEAESASAARRLDGVTGVWFTGGDQARVPPLLLGTPVLDAIRARYAEGAVLGGTSAGAAIMSDSMLTGEQHRADHDTSAYYGDEFPEVRRGVIEIVPGLGFLPGTIVDQHFLQRERHNRLLSVVLERPGLIGVGIDESTALEVDGSGRWTVRGASAVVVYDARASQISAPDAPRLGAIDVRMHLLPAGSAYDPIRGRATLTQPDAVSVPLSTDSSSQEEHP